MSWFRQESNEIAESNFFPVTSSLTGYGELTDKDTDWACTTNKGFRTETQIWYTILADGSFVMVQIIWSFIGVFLIPATSQMTFKIYNPHTKSAVWKSVNGSNAKHDGKNYKTDQFEIKHSGKAAGEEVYTISANLDKTVQISMTFTKPADAPGFKYGEGENGGFSFFGKDKSEEKRDGLVVHRFHPLGWSAGSLVINGKIVDAKGDAMFVHAIQGMRPNLVASRWNFAFFTSGGGNELTSLGSVRAVQMEFETIDDYGPFGKNSGGRTKVNIGAIYATAFPVAPLTVVGQTHGPDGAYPVLNSDVSSAVHIKPAKDSFTGYQAPQGVTFTWAGDRRDNEGRIDATLTVDHLDNGLIEKVDVLAEIPYVIRKSLAALTGTKPYIYQYLNATTLDVKLGEKSVPVKGWLFNEASFISD